MKLPALRAQRGELHLVKVGSEAIPTKEAIFGTDSLDLRVELPQLSAQVRPSEAKVLFDHGYHLGNRKADRIDDDQGMGEGFRARSPTSAIGNVAVVGDASDEARQLTNLDRAPSPAR